MKVKSIKLNFVLNNIRIIVNFLVPLITFPYVSRILGPEMLGKVDYANSIVAYYILFAVLGIPNYGIRAVSEVRDDKKKLSILIAEISLIISICTLIVLSIYCVSFFIIPNIISERLLYGILSLSIILSAFNYEWFYIGIEDQIFITIRFLIIRILSLVCLFLFVRDSSDYIKYALLTVIVGSLGSIFNVSFLRKYISFVDLKELHPIKHIKPILITFGASLAISIYTYVDITMIGSISGERYVGLYSGANKLVMVVLAVVTSLGSVIVPRLSNLLEKGDIENYKNHLYKSLNFILLLSLPCTIGLIVIGPELLRFLAGEKYEDATLTLQILACVITIISLAHYVGFQILYTNKKELYYTISVSAGALANLITNALLIPRFQHNGAALGSVMAELTGLIFMSILGHNYIKEYSKKSLKLLFYFVSSCLMGLAIFCINKVFDINVFIKIIIGMVVYFICILCSLRICKKTLKTYLKNFCL